MLKRIIILNVLSLFSTIYMIAENKILSTYPADGQNISILSRIDFEIEGSYGDYDTNTVGVMVSLSKVPTFKRMLYIYKGDASGTLLEKVTTSVSSEIGSNKVTINLSSDYKLEEGQLYTIILPTNCIWSWHDDSSKSANFIDKTSAADTITFYGGGEETQKYVTMQSVIPSEGTKVKTLGVFKLNFDGSILIAENAKASLYNGNTLVKEVLLTCAENADTTAVADFGNEVLAGNGYLNNYSIKIPKEAILSQDSTMLTRDLEIFYTGDTYNLFGYETITPAPESALSQIGTLRLVPDFPEGATPWQYAGNDGYVGKVYLYKGEDTTGEFIGAYSTDLGSDYKSVQATVTATLEPNATYALYLPEDLVPATYYSEGATTASKMRTWHSADTILIYHGANTVLDGKWSVTESDQLSKLGIVSFMTGGTATANEGAKMLLYNGEDSIASATLNASGTLCYADFSGLTLEQDGDYSLVIPDSAIVNMPKTTQKFKGIAKPAEYAKVSYKSNGITVASEQVLKGSKVSVDMAMPDSIQLDSLMLNGEKVSLADSVYAIDSLTADAEIEAALTYIPTPAPETVFYNVDYKVLSVVGDSTTPIASSTTKLAEDSVFTFQPKTLDENWSIAVSAGELTDSIYSLAITSDTTVTVTYTFNGEVKYVDETASGVYTLENSQEITISATQGKIIVEGAQAGDNISLYGLNGAKLGNWEVKQDKQTIDVNSGVYLVVVKGDNGKAAAKVSVK